MTDKELMNDKELLTLAAKAAGIEIHAYVDDSIGFIYGHKRMGYWNPLTDDGDALRLAVKLNLHIERWDNCVDVSPHDSITKYANEPDINSDPYAATRRAIVRTAAEIGKTQ